MLPISLYSLVVLHLLCCHRALTQDYIGCYKDMNDARALPQGTNSGGSPQICQRYCQSNSLYTYFGAQFGYECHCGETYDRHGKVNESDCSSPCPRDSSKKCGAATRNSVYYVCPKGMFGSGCNLTCHCKDGEYCSRNGTCLKGVGCEMGWEGKTSCQDIDECSRPGYCNQNCTNFPGSFSCSCYHSGFKLDPSDNITCRDVNECLINKGGCNHTCTNTDGSYHCTCDSGYILTAGGKQCQDNDECVVMNGKCSHFCNNTAGSYFCSCPENLMLSRDGLYCQKGPNFEPWKIAVIVVGGVIGLALIILAIVFLCRRCRHTSTAKPQTAGAKPQAETAKSFKRLTDNVQKMARQTVYGKRPPSGSEELTSVVSSSGESGRDVISKSDVTSDVKNGDVTVPLYANVTGSVSATRIKVEDLSKVVQGVRESSQSLSKDFKKLPERADESCSFAEQKELKPKNKYRNILPYNFNRVELSQVGTKKNSTYINASFIDGYKQKKKYIASHGPTPATLEDFLRMIWEQNVSIIIMLTRCKETAKVKCEQYWPDMVGEPRTSVSHDNSISIKLLSSDERLEYVTRRLLLSVGSEEREITQVQYTAWPDHGVPPYSIPMLALREKIRTLVSSQPASTTTHQPLLIHCSAGVGRTGTYIALDNLLEEAEDKREIDIHTTVLNLRKQRMNCVQTLEQYTFIYKALLEGLIFGVTRIPSARVPERLTGLSGTHPLTHKSVLQTEFNMLKEMQPLYTAEQCSDALSSKHVSKNRDPKLVPSNDQRLLFVGEVNSAKRYINAVMIPNHKKREAYIATQLPLESTLEDFWQICSDYKCRAVVVLTRDEQQEQDEPIISAMLPAPGKPHPLSDHLSVETLSVDEKSTGDGAASRSATYKVGIRCVAESKKSKEPKNNKESAIYENTKADSRSLQRLTVLVKSLPSDPDLLHKAIADVTKTMTSLTSMTDQSPPIMVTCRTGVSLCGPYIAASNCYTMVQSDDVIDVVQIVLDLKKAQPHFISTENDYKLVYQIAAELSSCSSSGRDNGSSGGQSGDRSSRNELDTLYENVRTNN